AGDDVADGTRQRDGKAAGRARRDRLVDAYLAPAQEGDGQEAAACAQKGRERADQAAGAEHPGAAGQAAFRRFGKALRTPAEHVRRRPCDEGPEEERSEEHTSELQSRENLVCRLLLEKNTRG